MVLYSFDFFLFFFFVFIVFWKLPKGFQLAVLLLASYYFYASDRPAYLGIIFLTTIINYFGGRALGRESLNKKIILFLTIFLDLSLLFVFKYLNFFDYTISKVGGFELPQFQFLLPIGISFYTLQIIGYLIDVYRGTIKPEKNLGVFALFVCFFPQLTAGPIERAKRLLPQLREKHVFNYEDVAAGSKLFLLGLFKKMAIADNLAITVDRVFNSLPDYKGLSLLIAIVFYSWQIYMDFSGYTDMARGIAKMVGINLMENFNLPYFADSIQDFWRRWHISFSSWLRDYIYIPLGGSRKGFIWTLVNVIIVFAVSGLWHGAAWNFILWGTLYGLLMSVERIAKKIFGEKISLPRLVRIVYTYCVVSILWVFFRAPTISDAFYIFRNIFVGIKNIINPDYIVASLSHLFDFNTQEAILVLGLLIIAISLDLLQRKMLPLDFLKKKNVVVRYAIYALMLFMIIQLRNADIKEFIYTRF